MFNCAYWFNWKVKIISFGLLDPTSELMKAWFCFILNHHYCRKSCDENIHRTATSRDIWWDKTAHLGRVFLCLGNHDQDKCDLSKFIALPLQGLEKSLLLFQNKKNIHTIWILISCRQLKEIRNLCQPKLASFPKPDPRQSWIYFLEQTE